MEHSITLQNINLMVFKSLFGKYMLDINISIVIFFFFFNFLATKCS